MKEMIVTLLPHALRFLPLVAVLSLMMRSEYNKRFHLFFPVQVAFMIMSAVVSFCWFATGREFVFYYGPYWEIIERGTLKALSSVTGTIGVSCLFLGWTYSEREKFTLGCRQIDIVRYRYGLGYGLSIIIHFAATVLCGILLECKAREAALWAFTTIVWGCIPQALICLRIVINREHREKRALELWAQKGENSADRFLVLQDMAKYLTDADVHRNMGYRETMGKVIMQWLMGACRPILKDYGITAESVKRCSAIYHEISERLPQEERMLFEEDILKYVCTMIEEKTDKTGDAPVALLCAGYMRYLFSQSPTEMETRIIRTVYYSQHENLSYQTFGSMMKAFSCGLEWYQYLTQRMGLPKYAELGKPKNAYMEIAFKALIHSVFEDDVQNNDDKDVVEDTLDYVQIAWNQVYPGGGHE